MADSDFVEEFDSSSSESGNYVTANCPAVVSGQRSSSFTQNSFYPSTCSVNLPNQDYPSWPWPPELLHRDFYSTLPITNILPPTATSDNVLQPAPFYFPQHRSSSAYASTAFLHEINSPLESIPEAEKGTSTVLYTTGIGIKKKTRRKQHYVKLTSFGESIRNQAWEIYQNKHSQSKLTKFNKTGNNSTTSSITNPTNNSVENASLEKSMQTSITYTPVELELESAGEAIKESSTSAKLHRNSTTMDSCNSKDLSQLIKKFKSQQRKRTREKLKRGKKAEERKQNVLLDKKNVEEIDKWIIDQRALFEKERHHRLLLSEGKKSLSEVAKKKQEIQDRLRLLTFIQKIRDAREKTMRNTMVGYWNKRSEMGISSASAESLDFRFSSGSSRLKQALEKILYNISEEERMIKVMMEESKNGSGSPGSATICQGSRGIDTSPGTIRTGTKRCVHNAKNQEMITPISHRSRERCQKKWEKWLMKKSMKDQDKCIVQPI